MKICVNLLGVSVLIWLAWYFVDVGLVYETLSNIDLFFAFIALMLEFVYYVIESVRIQALAQNNFTFFQVIRTRVLSVFIGNFAPGLGAGELIRILLLDFYKPGHKIFLLCVMIANKVYMLLSLGIVLSLSLLFGESFNLPWLNHFSPVTLVVIAMGFAFAPLFFSIRVFRRLSVGFVIRLKGVFKSLARSLHVSMTSVSSPKSWLISTSSSLVSTLFIVLQFYCLSKSVGLNVDILIWVLWVPLIALFSFLPIGVGAVGSQDAGFALMSQVTGLNLETLLVVSLLAHGIRIFGSLPGLLFVKDLKALITMHREVKNPLLRKFLKTRHLP